jgi:Flp pilus assembly protein TadD
MNTKNKFLITLIAFFLIGEVFCQVNPKNNKIPTTQIEKIREEGVKLYKEQKYEEAKPLFSKILALHPTDTAALNKRGNCYLETNQLDSAMLDFRQAIKVAPSYPSPYFNLAIAYINKEQYQQAIYLLHKYSELKPNVAESWGEQGVLYRQLEKYDSSFMMLAKAYELNSKEIQVIYYLSVSYYEQNEYDKAIKLAEEGQLLSKPDDHNFYTLAGFIYAQKKDYKKAFEQMSEALIRKKDSEIESYKIRYKLLANTDLAKLNFKENAFFFRELSNTNLRTLDKWAKDTTHPFYHPTLLEKFKRDALSMSLEEYFMLYYGQSVQNSYSPYGSVINREVLKEVYKDLDVKDYQKSLEKTEKILEANPLDFNTYYYHAISHYELGNYEKYYESIFKFKAFMTALLATGDGLTFETAFLVILVSDEYNLLNYLGYKTTAQALVNNNGFSYDRMSVVGAKSDEEKKQEGEEKEVNLLFNIQKSFDGMSNIFDEKIDDKDKGKTKKERKKDKKKKEKNKDKDND